jgi:hypothetical protein
MITPCGNWMMGVSPTPAARYRTTNRHVELFRSEVAMEVGIEFANRRSVANSETAVDDLDGEFAVGRCSAVCYAPNVFQILHQALRAHDVTRHAMTQEHEMVATGLGAKVGIKGEKAIDASRGGAKVFGHDLGCAERHPAKVFVDLLESGKDQFLSFLKISIVKVGKDSLDFREVNIIL